MAVIGFLKPLMKKSWKIDELYHTYRNQMYALAFSILHSQMEAEDAVHDVFVRVASNRSFLEKITSQEDMRNYLLKATKNMALNALRKTSHEVPFAEQCDTNDPELSDEEFWDAVFRRGEYEEVVRAIRELDGKYADVLYCHFVLEMTVPETAQALDRSIPAVKQQLVRGKKMLLTNLEHRKGARYGGKQE